jgi:hypothetical protein
MAKGRGGGVAHGKLDRPLIGARAVARQPSDGGGWWLPKACGEGVL